MLLAAWLSIRILRLCSTTEKACKKQAFPVPFSVNAALVAERAGIRKLDRVTDACRIIGLGAAPAAGNGGVGRQGVKLRGILDVAYFLSRSFHGSTLLQGND
jgi:hypothetical protein